MSPPSFKISSVTLSVRSPESGYGDQYDFVLQEPLRKHVLFEDVDRDGIYTEGKDQLSIHAKEGKRGYKLTLTPALIHKVEESVARYRQRLPRKLDSFIKSIKPREIKETHSVQPFCGQKAYESVSWTVTRKGRKIATIVDYNGDGHVDQVTLNKRHGLKLNLLTTAQLSENLNGQPKRPCFQVLETDPDLKEFFQKFNHLIKGRTP